MVSLKQIFYAALLGVGGGLRYMKFVDGNKTVMSAEDERGNNSLWNRITSAVNSIRPSELEELPLLYVLVA